MKILFVGKINLDYNRVRVLINGLKKREDVEVRSYEFKKRSSFDKAHFLELEKDVDYIYVPPFRHQDIKLIKKYTSKPIIFDPLISKFMTKVIDYGHFWKAPIKYWLDFIPFHRADILLTDTLLHKKYFSKTFFISEDKIKVLPIGVDTTDFNHKKVLKFRDNVFKVGFYGSFIPLQGVDVIIDSAILLKDVKDIKFELIGDGVFYEKIKSKIAKHKLTNVLLKGWVKYEELNIEIAKYDICLGIFGKSFKTDIVIPNKVWHYAAMGKCIITKDTPGIKEVFTDNKNIVLIPNTAKALAETIFYLKSDFDKIDSVGVKAAEVIQTKYTEEHIADIFINAIK
ncbi:glycosyltransferase [Wenyingzhuangia marina]|uniref:Glycosyltransferase involved in cell wall bisynthesis n=1 Tax=Wenyingzhuangia marina TaxID=1195760 RepID=A0A1M5WS96_9FLAO|nr:glycosyltransferase [Wenyingzhuangia marina]SHH90486.1 Glycosyltransferase involved in cell wall bisynthesis [Wenyingzhuangia marina]